MEPSKMHTLELKTARVSTDSDGVMTVWIDAPGKGVNTITSKMLEDLTEIVVLIEREKPKAVIFTSAKQDCFIAGGDLFEIRSLTAETMTDFLAGGQKLYDRIGNLPMPTVCAMNGDCLGGGMELALACKYRVAADDGSINIGLPETKIGILPGWGGTVRLPKLIGITRALPLILQGKALPPKKAKKIGMIDETVRPEALLAAAKRIALNGVQRKTKLALVDRLCSNGFIRRRVLASAEAKTMAATHGNYPSAQKVIDIVRTSFDLGHAAGLDAERSSLRDLIDTDTSHNLMRLFFLKQRVKRAIADQLKAKPVDVKTAAVIGGGTMGAGIVHSLVRAGVQVRLIEVNAQAAAAALGRVRKTLDEDVYAGKLTALEAKHAFNRVSPSTEWTGLGSCDLVVEAVAETIEVKREVFAKLDKLCRPDAVLASNTSSLSITEMAAATAHPNRVVGLHFFNPVSKMPLVEVVRTEHSDDASLATAAALSGKIGKVPVLVKDAPGFLVNRVLIPYLAEALVLAEEGATITHVDETMKKWGMPMGPFELLDEIGLDIGAHVLQSLGSKLETPLKPSPVVGRALERKWLGKKSGCGFYIHGKKKGAKLKPNAELISLLTAVQTKVEISEGDIVNRLVMPMVNEAARLLSEGVTDSADTVDLATVLGLGFAPFRGGLAKFADKLTVDGLVETMGDLARRAGLRFRPAPVLEWLAKEKKPFADAVQFKPAPAPAPAPVAAPAASMAMAESVARSPHA